MGRLKAGQCGYNRAGRRVCVLPLGGMRYVAKDFDPGDGFSNVEATDDETALAKASEHDDEDDTLQGGFALGFARVSDHHDSRQADEDDVEDEDDERDSDDLARG